MKTGNRSATVVAHRDATAFGEDSASGNRNKTALNHMFSKSPLPLDVTAGTNHHSEEKVELFGSAVLVGNVTMLDETIPTAGLKLDDLVLLGIDESGISSDASSYYGKFDGVDFDPNYSLSPDMTTVVNPTEPDGTAYNTIAIGTDSATGATVAYIPNPTSPGEIANQTNMDPSKIDELDITSEIPTRKTSQYGSSRARGAKRSDEQSVRGVIGHSYTAI